MSQPIVSGSVGTGAVDRVAELASIFATDATFRAFYDRALPRVYGYLVSRCGGDRSAAEELAQETFIAAIRERRSFDGRSDPMTWLIAIARHKLTDQYRRREREEGRRLRLLVREVEVGLDASAWRSADERDEIVRVLATLPIMQRAVLVLHYADGLPVREIAAQLGKTEAAVESLMSRARDAFRKTYRGAER